MRSTICLCLGLLFLAACTDRQASQEIEARQRFEAAVKLIDEAERGFVPTAEGQPFNSDMQAYRQEKFDQAAVELEAALQGGSPAIQVGAARMLADLHRSAARDISRDARNAWARLGAEASAMLRLMLEVETAHRRAQTFDTDESQLIAQLKSYQAAEQRKLSTAKQDITEHEKVIADLQKQIQTLEAESDQLIGRVQKLQEQAFVAKGAKRYDALDEAAALQRQAQVKSTQAQEMGVKLSVHQAELAILREQAESAQTLAQSLAQQISNAEQRQRQVQLAYDQALEQKDKAVAAVMATFEKLAKDYTQNVEASYTEAMDRLAEADKLLKSVLSKAKGADLRAVRLDLLGTQVDIAHVGSEHVQALGVYGASSQALSRRSAAGEVMSQRAAFLAEHTQQLAGKQDALIASVRTTIDEAAKIAEDLSAGPEDASLIVAVEQGQRLQTYNQQLDAARIQQGV